MICRVISPNGHVPTICLILITRRHQGNGTEKVVRGGSWTDHPKTSTAYYRKSYLPWQKVHNVGFRVIIED